MSDILQRKGLVEFKTQTYNDMLEGGLLNMFYAEFVPLEILKTKDSVKVLCVSKHFIIPDSSLIPEYDVTFTSLPQKIEGSAFFEYGIKSIIRKD